eukprot:403338391
MNSQQTFNPDKNDKAASIFPDEPDLLRPVDSKRAAFSQRNDYQSQMSFNPVLSQNQQSMQDGAPSQANFNSNQAEQNSHFNPFKASNQNSSGSGQFDFFSQQQQQNLNMNTGSGDLFSNQSRQSQRDMQINNSLNPHTFTGEFTDMMGSFDQLQNQNLFTSEADAESFSPEEDDDIFLYNEILESQRLFKQQLDLQAHQYRLALHNSMINMLSRLPKDIRNMSASEFLLKQSEDDNFQQDYNIPFQVVDNSSIGILQNVLKLFQPLPQVSLNLNQTIVPQNSSAGDQPNSDYIQAQPSPNELLNSSQNRPSDVSPSRETKDQEIQCRFSMRMSGINQPAPNRNLDPNPQPSNQNQFFMSQNERDQFQNHQSRQQLSVTSPVRVDIVSDRPSRRNQYDASDSQQILMQLSNQKRSQGQESQQRTSEEKQRQITGQHSQSEDIQHQANKSILNRPDVQMQEDEFEEEIKENHHQSNVHELKKSKANSKRRIVQDEVMVNEEERKEDTVIKKSQKKGKNKKQEKPQRKSKSVDDTIQEQVVDDEGPHDKSVDESKQEIEVEEPMQIDTSTKPKPQKTQQSKKVAVANLNNTTRRNQTRRGEATLLQPKTKPQQQQRAQTQRPNTRNKGRKVQVKESDMEEDAKSNDSHVMTRAQYRESLTNSRQNSAIKDSRQFNGQNATHINPHQVIFDSQDEYDKSSNASKDDESEEEWSEKADGSKDISFSKQGGKKVQGNSSSHNIKPLSTQNANKPAKKQSGKILASKVESSLDQTMDDDSLTEEEKLKLKRQLAAKKGLETRKRKQAEQELQAKQEAEAKAEAERLEREKENLAQELIKQQAKKQTTQAKATAATKGNKKKGKK